jgi:hypothetical protein
VGRLVAPSETQPRQIRWETPQGYNPGRIYSVPPIKIIRSLVASDIGEQRAPGTPEPMFAQAIDDNRQHPALFQGSDLAKVTVRR